MAAKDYVIAESCFENLYLVKQTKSKTTMSQDRRPITDSECIGCAYSYLKRRCKELDTDTVVITNSKGEQLFEMKLLKKEEE